MVNCIKNGNFIVVVLDSGVILQSSICDDEMYNAISNAENDDAIIGIFYPEIEESIKQHDEALEYKKAFESCPIFSVIDNVITIPQVCGLSVPIEIAEKIYDAWEKGDEDELTSYINFWTLLALNPDDLCRNNLLKFLNKWGMEVVKSGLIVGYRNAETTEEEGIYTDVHSHRTRIELGKLVTMPRRECNSDSHVSCSRGLHIGGTKWLKQGYFGNTGLVCLINPVDVVAVPFDNEEYGKLRTCAYLPFEIAKFDDYGCVIPYFAKSGADVKYVKDIIYDGIKASEEEATYRIEIPSIAEIHPESITDNILAIARTFMK